MDPRLFAHVLAAPLNMLRTYAAPPTDEATAVQDATLANIPPPFAPDQTERARQAVWSTASSALGYLEGLRTHARGLLVRDGSRLVLELDRDEPGRELVRWRWISLALPSDMLAALACNGDAPPTSHIQLLPRVFAPPGPHAHIHLHLKACVNFGDLWKHLVSYPAWVGEVRDAPKPLTTGAWTSLLLRALVVRRVLTEALLQGCSIQDVRDRLTVDARGLVRASLSGIALGDTREFSSPTISRLRRIVFSTGRRSTPTLPEGMLISRATTRALRGLEPEFERLLLQYLRVRCILHRHLVHDPKRPGLENFDEIFRRLKAFRGGLGNALVEFPFSDPDLEVGSVEVRVAPDRARDIREHVDAMRGHRERKRVETGLVYHLIRTVESESRPSQLNHASRFRKLSRELSSQAGVLLAALDGAPRRLDTIRGVDLAGQERAGPLWIALPHLRRILGRAEVLAARVGHPGLGVTLHAGEDFAHLATGLRTVAEPVDARLLRRGDRIGHARALGLDASSWCDENPKVFVTRWDRLLDLGCALAYLPRFQSQLAKGEFGDLHAQLTLEIEGHFRKARISGPADLAISLYDSLLEESKRAVEVCVLGIRPSTSDSLKIATRYVGGDPALNALVPVETRRDLAWLNPLQRKLLERLARWPVTIEVNPTSNLLVGGTTRLLDQPHFRLHPLADAPSNPRPPIAIDADDPLTFATTLSAEYAYTWASLVADGEVPPGVARSWLEDVAQAGWRARFTLK